MSDLFDAAELVDGTWPEGFLPSNAEGRAECLKVKPGMEMAPSRMEPRRHASIPEETTESRTMEGMVFNPDKNSLRVAMSEVGKSMTDADGTADPGGRNGMRLTKNAIGAVYELALDAEYKAGSMSALVWGKPT